MNKKIFIGAAWPYANGSLHLGHVAGLIGADILARFYRLRGHEVLFVSGSDCHGTPIAVEAERQGIVPSEIAEKYHNEFKETLISGLSFSYDLYTKTTTENHQKVVQEIFLKLYKTGHIYLKELKLPYCHNCRRFLPDRYIEGECPVCHFGAARGDQCDECGNLLDPDQLIKPHCKICGNSPEWLPSEHFFFKLSSFQDQIKAWVENSAGWRVNAKNFTLNLIKQGLPDRAITRDIEWGVPIPLPGYESKRIYVWFEAVCGYLSASKEWAHLNGQDELWKNFWTDNSVEHIYVHGKDNIPFHTIIWPAILLAHGDLHLPNRIVSSEYLMLEGKQFSKSRNWAVWLPDFLKEFDSEALRYFLIASGPETADNDFSWTEYLNKVNGELIGNFGNFIHRTLSLVKDNFPEGVKIIGELNEKEEEFIRLTQESFDGAEKAIKESRFREGLRNILKLAEHGNRYLQETAPWESIKTDRARTEKTLAVALKVISNLAILVSPYLPKTADKIKEMVNLDASLLKWQYLDINSFKIEKLQPLYKKIETENIEKQIAKLNSKAESN